MSFEQACIDLGVSPACRQIAELLSWGESELRAAVEEALIDSDVWVRAGDEAYNLNIDKMARLEAAAPDGHRLTDAGNAQRLIDLYGDQLRFVREQGRWIVYNRGHGKWELDPTNVQITGMVKGVAHHLMRQSIKLTGAARTEMFTAACKLERSSNINAAVALARDLVVINFEDLNADPSILNVSNGIVDLETGRLDQWNINNLCTKQAPVHYDPGWQSDLWLRCLKRWQPDPEIRDYLQLEAGAAATGFPTETLSIHYGPGGNGKSKFFGALQAVLGDYAVPAHRSLVLQTRNEQHATVLASLAGARLAVLSETGTTSKLNAEQVKNLTGGDRMRARFMHQDEFSFDPTHTLIMWCNHMPIIQDDSEGTWRRVRKIEWSVTIPDAEKDPYLLKKLTSVTHGNPAGIMTWIVEGARRFIAGGYRLDAPTSVMLATSQYRDNEDVPGRFIRECLVVNRSERVPNRDLKQQLESFCTDNGLDEPRWSEVTEKLIQAGGKTVVANGSRCWEGFKLAEGLKYQGQLGL